MSIVPQPHRAADLIIGGAQGVSSSLGEGMKFAHSEQVANQPIHPAMQAYIERLLRGEDPTKLGLEARNDPNMAQLIDSRRRPPQQAGIANNVPDVGAPGGQPTLGAPGQFSPAAGPGTQPNAPTSLGQVAGQAHGGAKQAIAPQQLQPAGQSLIGSSMARPMGPQVDSQQAFNAAQPRPKAPAPAAKPQAPQGAPQSGMPPITNRQFAGMQNMLPSMIAAQGRGDAAAIQAQTKLQIARLDAEKSTLLAVMKENGLDTRHFEQMLKATETLDVSQQQAVLKAVVDLMKSQMSAGATMGAARTRAEAPKGPNATLETLKKEIGELQALKSKTDWEKQPETVQRIQELEDNIKIYKESLGVPMPGNKPTGPKAPAPEKKTGPAPQKSDSGGMPKVRKDGKILVRSKQTGQQGYVSPGFDPAKYEKL